MKPIIDVRPSSSLSKDCNAQTWILVRVDCDPEFALIIQLPLYKPSVWDSGAKHGAELKRLRYRVPLTGTSQNIPPFHETII